MPDSPFAAYDAIADWYQSTVREDGLLHRLVSQSVFEGWGGDLVGGYVCDLGCGPGQHARRMARHGASVLGIDVSEGMLRIARAEEDADPLGVVYRQDDAATLGSLDDAVFDGVLCCMALIDIPDLDAALRSVARVLKPGGWFVFAITHPCFQLPSRPDAEGAGRAHSYFEEGFWLSENPEGVRGKVGSFHRTLATYLSALTEAGLALVQLREPRLEGRDEPVLLVARCRRCADSEPIQSPEQPSM